jgi:hypothetical protein
MSRLWWPPSWLTLRSPSSSAITDRIAAAVDHWDEIPPGAITELRSAIDLMRGGKACATVSALLAARSELTTPTEPI